MTNLRRLLLFGCAVAILGCAETDGWTEEHLRTLDRMEQVSEALGSLLLELDATPPGSGFRVSDLDAHREISIETESLPLVPSELLAGLLVPDYLDELPQTDAWGHPLIVRVGGLNLVVQSAGPDGEPHPGPWKALGQFGPDTPPYPEVDDLVLLWKDGVFVRWAERTR